jgi:hypothetical protein
MPGVDEREQIWRVQMHPTLTPLAEDVDFRDLAEKYEVSGGDIRNAVLKAALAAASSPEHDTLKVIRHHHLEDGIKDVIAGRRVMQQSLFNDARMHPPRTRMEELGARTSSTAVYAFAMAGAALIVALLALLMVLFR